MLCLFLFQLQREHDLFFVIEARDSSSGGLGAIFLGVDFIIDIGIEATEAVIAFFIRDIAAHGIGARVFQKNHGGRHWRFGGLVHHNTAHRAKLRFVLGVLLDARAHAHGQSQYHEQQTNAGPHHFPLLAGSMRKTTLFSPEPVRASMVLAWSAKPLACTTISYCVPCGTRIANSPRELVRSSQRNFFSPERRMRSCTPGKEIAWLVKTVPRIRKSLTWLYRCAFFEDVAGADDDDCATAGLLSWVDARAADRETSNAADHRATSHRTGMIRS